VHPLGSISLIPFGSPVDFVYVSELSSGWDWNLSDKASLNEFVETFRNNAQFLGFWVKIEDIPYGLISFRPYTEQPTATLSFGIFIHKDKRANGLASILMSSSIKAMQELNVPMVATVHKDNARSVSMIRRTTGQEGVSTYEPSKNRDAYLFNLDKTHCSVETFDEECVEQILREKEIIHKLLLSR